MAKKKSVASETIELRRLEEETIRICIVGMTPLIPHRWSEKARRMMPGHPERDTVKKTKDVRKPEEEAEACLYKLGKSLAMPATAFKAALVGACRLFDKPSMQEAKQLLFVVGDGPEQLVKITAAERVLREDPARNANGGADLRYRYALVDWSAEVDVRYVPSIISRASVIALMDAAGRSGVGDWRPSSPKSLTGTYGTWRVNEKKEVRTL